MGAVNFIVTTGQSLVIDLITSLNNLTEGNIRTEDALLITPDEGMTSTIRDILTASGLPFHELQDKPAAPETGYLLNVNHMPSTEPAKPKRERKGSKQQYTVLDGTREGTCYDEQGLRMALSIHELEEGTHVQDKKRGEMLVAAYPNTKKLHLITVHQETL